MARCENFWAWIYRDFEATSKKSSASEAYLSHLKSICPPVGRGNNTIVPLDYVTPNLFDNSIYHLLLQGEGLLNSDQEMYSSILAVQTEESVRKYVADPIAFFVQFSESMVRLGSITNPKSFANGEVRKNCRFINTWAPEI